MEKLEDFKEKVIDAIKSETPMPERFGNKSWLEFAGFGLSDHADETQEYDIFNQFFDFVNQNYELDEFQGGLAKRLLKTRFDFYFQNEDWQNAVPTGEQALLHEAKIKTNFEKAQKKLEEEQE